MIISPRQRPDPERIKYLWSKLRQSVRIPLIFKRMGSDIKMFGANETVEIRFKKDPRLLIHPNSKMRKSWNCLLLLCLTVSSVLLPFHATFSSSSSLWKRVKLVQDLVFLADIPLNFITSFWYHEHTLIKNRRQIASKYLKSWLVVDLISCIPFQFLSGYSSLLCLSSLAKLLKLNSCLSFPNFIALNFNHSVQRLVKIVAATMILVQILACFWYLIAITNDYPDESWMISEDLQNKDDVFKYITCIYWVFVTITTVGFGDITPKNTVEKVYAMIVMGFGVAFFALTISHLTSIISEIDQKTKLLNSKLSILTDFAREIKLPRDVYEKIRQTLIKNSSENLSLYNESNIVSDLPSFLRSELTIHLHKTLIEKIKFFKGKSPLFLSFTVPKLKNMSCNQSEYLYHIDDEAFESKTYLVYFIKSGRVLLKASNGAIFRAYPLGSYFGEIELLENTNRTSIAQISTKPAELLTLSKKNLEMMFKEFPEIMDELTRVAKVRQKLNLDAMEHVLQLRVDDESMESESSSDPSESDEQRLRPQDWLLRRDTGILVSHMTISPNKVKNISKWSKAVKATKRARSVLENQSTETLIARKRSMKKLASLKYVRSKNSKLQRIKKGMRVKEELKEVDLVDDVLLTDDFDTQDVPDEIQVQGILEDIIEINMFMNDHADDSTTLLKEIENIDLDIIEDCKKLHQYCMKRGLIETTDNSR